MSRAVVLASILIIGGCSAEQPSSTQRIAPAASTSPRADATPLQSSSATEPRSFADADGELRPGTYVVEYGRIGGRQSFPTLGVAITVPAGWSRVLVDGLLWNEAGMRVGLSVVDNVYLDPCRPELGVHSPPVASSVVDLADALEELPGWEVTDVTPETYFGYAGLRLTMRRTPGAECPVDEPRLAHSYGFPGFLTVFGDDVRLWILAVEGSRVVIHADTDAGLPDDSAAELQAVLDSIEIRP